MNLFCANVDLFAVNGLDVIARLFHSSVRIRHLEISAQAQLPTKVVKNNWMIHN